MAIEYPTRPDLQSLVALFYEQTEQFGVFKAVSAQKTPPPYRDLLHHNHHMTVTVESFHKSKVDVEVLDYRYDGDLYSRRILLKRQDNASVVQHGIVRLNLSVLAERTRKEIESRTIPLGRVLIEHGVLRQVELHNLYEVRCGADLADSFAVDEGTITFGRTALIYCNHEPAVELLEIVSPVPESS